jgi:hypothetical protein
MVGSSVPAAAGACSGAGPVAGRPSPTPEGEGAGVAAPGVAAGCLSPVVGGDGAGAAGAGAALAGAGGDCGDGIGAVWAKAPAQSDEIKKDVEASKRGRNDTESPSPGKRTTIHPCALLRTVTVFDRRPGIFPHRHGGSRIPIQRRASSSQASMRSSRITHTNSHAAIPDSTTACHRRAIA